MDKIGHLSSNSDERVLVKAFGIRLAVSARGTLGYFDLMLFALMLSAATTMLRLADFFVKRILVQIYRKIPSYHHIFLAYSFYTRDVTPLARHLREDVQSSTHEEHPINDRVV